MANPTSPTPASLASEIAAVRARAARVTSGLTRDALNWQPDDGRRWSIGQCLDHLARSNDSYLNAIDAAIAIAAPRANGSPFVAKSNFLGRVFAGTLEPPPRVRVRASGSFVPASHVDPAEIAGRFEASLDRVLATIPRAWTIDPNRTRYRNPLARNFKVFNVTAGFQILTAHNRRHLWQAEQVRARPEFPRS